MPAGMVLRSASDWHLDPAGRHTLEAFLGMRGQIPADAEPLPLGLYLEYADWFAQAKGIRSWPARVVRLDQGERGFVAKLDDGSILTADRVLLASGYAPFAHVPDEVMTAVPAEYRSHTSDLAEPARLAGKRILILGGRQSAFESAALLAEAGATAVHVCHRHATPAFVPSDWSWVEPTLDRIVMEPEWYRRLPDVERKQVDGRFFAEGRLKLEPWLGPRVHRSGIAIRPSTRFAGCELRGDELIVRLETGERIPVDRVICATGYRVDLHRVPFLAAGDLLPAIEQRDGFPVLDTSLQTSVPGLFITSLPATRDFGPFFGFTVSVRASARIVGAALRHR